MAFQTLRPPSPDPWGMANTQAVRGILKTLGRLEAVRQKRSQTTAILTGLAQGKTIQEMAQNPAFLEPQFSAGIPGFFQRIGSAFAPQTGVEDIMLRAALQPSRRAAAPKRRALTVFTPKGKKRPMLVSEDKYEQTVADLEAKGYTFEKPEDEGLTLSEFLTQLRNVDKANISTPAKKVQKQTLMRKYGRVLPEIKGMKLKEILETYGPLLDVAEPEAETMKVTAYSPQGIKQPLLVPKGEQFNPTIQELLTKGWTFEESEKEKFSATPWYLKPERIGTPEGKAALNKAMKAGTKFDIKQINDALYHWTHDKEGNLIDQIDNTDLFTLREMLKGTGYRLREITIEEPKERWWWWDSVVEKPKWILENAQGQAIPPPNVNTQDWQLQGMLTPEMRGQSVSTQAEPATVEDFEAEVARLKATGDTKKAKAYYDKWVTKWQ